MALFISCVDGFVPWVGGGKEDLGPSFKLSTQEYRVGGSWTISSREGGTGTRRLCTQGWMKLDLSLGRKKGGDGPLPRICSSSSLLSLSFLFSLPRMVPLPPSSPSVSRVSRSSWCAGPW